MSSFYSYDDYKNMKAMIKGIQESQIKPGLKKMVNECWQAYESKMYKDAVRIPLFFHAKL